MSSDTLTVSDLSVRYGSARVLERINLDIAQGSLLAVLGRNGAGKTSLVRGIMGVGVKATGKVILGGQDVSSRPSFERARRGLQLVPEDRRIYSIFTVRENLELSRNACSGRAAMTIDEVLALFPSIEPLLLRRGNQLSGGEQELVAIARAIMARPSVLIMDEPSQGLAPKVLQTVGAAITALRDHTGTTVVLTEQNVRFAVRLADHVAVLANGGIASYGSAAEFVADPSLATRYLGATV